MDSREIAREFIKSAFSKSKRELLINPNEQNKRKLIYYVIKHQALVDATQGMNYKGRKIENKIHICGLVLEQIKKLHNITNYEVWHREAIESLEKYLQLGEAQKLINMSVKYLYFLEIGYDVDFFEEVSFKNYENSFHVPIDSYILKWFILNSNATDGFAEYGSEIVAWSNLSDKDTYYYFLQPQIKAKMKTIEPQLPILCAETIIWSNIKELKKAIEWDF